MAVAFKIGQTSILQKLIGENISALKCVYAIDPNTVKIASPLTYAESTVLGVAKTAGLIGEEIDIITEGELEDGLFNFPVNAPLFLGLNGSITDVPPSSGHHKPIGFSMGVGKIYIGVMETTILV